MARAAVAVRRMVSRLVRSPREMETSLPLARSEAHDLATTVHALRIGDLNRRGVVIDDLAGGSCGGAQEGELVSSPLPLQVRNSRNQAGRHHDGEAHDERQLRHAETGIHTDESVKRLPLTLSAAAILSRCDPAPVSRNDRSAARTWVTAGACGSGCA